MAASYSSSSPSCSYTRPKFAIASLSLGTNAHHDLPTKIRVTSELGYDGIEIFIPDFEAFVKEARGGKHAQLFDKPLGSFTPTELDLACATAIYTLCESYHLEIPLFQPFRNFENFRTQAQIDAGLEEAERWLRIMPVLKCDLLLVCSNFVPPPCPISEGYTFEMYCDAQVDAFRQLGALAERYSIRIGYEPLSWGTVICNWMQVWDIVKRVDRDNVGILLDSFNTLGNQYADPGQPSALCKGQTLSAMLANLEEMSRTIPTEKIFFYQIADAVRPPEICYDSDDMPRRMKWSRACRVFPCEPPENESHDTLSDTDFDSENPPSGYLGFLPVTQMTSVIHRTGYRGWWSLEVFNSSLQESDASCTVRHGRRGIDGLRALWDVVKADPMSEQPSTDSELLSDIDDITSRYRNLTPSPTPSTPQLSSGSGSESSESAVSSDIELETELPEAAGKLVPSNFSDEVGFESEEMRVSNAGVDSLVYD